MITKCSWEERENNREVRNLGEISMEWEKEEKSKNEAEQENHI